MTTNYPPNQPWTAGPLPPPQPPAPPTPPKRSWSTKRKVLVAVLAIVGLFLLVGGIGAAVGGDGGGGKIDPNKAAGATPNPMPSIPSEQAEANSSAAAEPSPSDTGGDPGTAAVGDTIRYEDGIEVSVTKVARVSFSDVSYGSRGTGVAVTVKITNGGAETMDLVMSDVALTYGASGDEAEQVFDTERGFNGGFDTKLPHGRSATAKYGFAVPRGATTVSVQVTPDFASETAIFDGKVS